jgi:hypothetical protein
MSNPAAASPAAAPQRREIVVVSHSTLFYWWPVWAVGFLMALITLVEHQFLVTVPPETEHYASASGELKVTSGSRETTNKIEKQDALVAPAKHPKLSKPSLMISPNKSLGVIFVITLLLVIAITSVPMRGLWSVIVIIVIILVSVIFALLHVWDDILGALGQLDIRINLGGYLFISITLLSMWLVVFFFFDRQIYMVFSPGSLRVQLAIGDGETTYDTAGMTVQKQRSDLFRHWILGLGSGDLIVTTAGAQTHHFDLPNVLSLGRRVREIEELLRMKEVVAQAPTRK